MTSVSPTDRIATLVTLAKQAQDEAKPLAEEASRLRMAGQEAERQSQAAAHHADHLLAALEGMLGQLPRTSEYDRLPESWATLPELPFREWDLPGEMSDYREQDPCPTVREIVREQARQRRRTEQAAA